MVYYITTNEQGRDRLSAALGSKNVIALFDNGKSNADIITEMLNGKEAGIIAVFDDCARSSFQWRKKDIALEVGDIFPFDDTQTEDKTLLAAFEIYGNETVINTIRSEAIKQRAATISAERRRKRSIIEVLNTQEQPPTELVKDFITQGLNIVVGVPKVGKSFFCLQMAANIATGTKFLNKETTKAPVLYYALEEHEAVTNKRLRGIGITEKDFKKAEAIDFCYEADTIKNGLSLDISKWLFEHNAPAIVIIDTYQRAKGARKGNADPFEDAYDFGIRMKAIADMNNAAIVLIHHANKRQIDRKNEDIFDKILGSQGIAAAADNLIFIDREPHKTPVTVYSKGRYISQSAFIAETDEQMRWAYVCDNAEEINEAEAYNSNALVILLREMFKRYGESGRVWYSELKQLQAEMMAAGKLKTRAFSEGRDISLALSAGLADEIEEKDGYTVEAAKPIKKNGKTERGIVYALAWWKQGTLENSDL